VIRVYFSSSGATGLGSSSSTTAPKYTPMDIFSYGNVTGGADKQANDEDLRNLRSELN